MKTTIYNTSNIHSPRMSQKEKRKIRSEANIGFVLGYIARQMEKQFLTKDEREEIIYLTQQAAYGSV